MQPQANGKNVNITYRIWVKLIYDTYCANQPEWTIPLHILPPELPNYGLIQAPEGWNPMIFDEINLVLPVQQDQIVQDQNLSPPDQMITLPMRV